MEYIHSIEEEAGVRIKSFGRAGDGNLHVYILKDQLSDEEGTPDEKAYGT